MLSLMYDYAFLKYQFLALCIKDENHDFRVYRNLAK